MDKTLQTMIRAAEAGGTVIRKYFGTTLQKTLKKSYSDYQTKADIGSERVIVKILRKAFPEHAITAEEETKQDGSSSYRFIIDPLDGTNNFVLGVPYVGVSIGLIKDNKLMYGVVRHPMLRQTFHAKRGGGAYRDGKKIHVSRIKTIANTTVGITINYDTSQKKYLQFYNRLVKSNPKRVTNYWSPALDLCMVADGRAEALVSYDNELYDFCAGKLMVMEAGGTITDIKGKKEADETNRYFVASNGTAIHSKLIKVLS